MNTFFIPNEVTPFARHILCVFRFSFLTPLNRRRLRDPLFKRLFNTFKTAPTAGGLSKNSFCSTMHTQLSRVLHANATLMQKVFTLFLFRSSRELDSRRSDSTPSNLFNFHLELACSVSGPPLFFAAFCTFLSGRTACRSLFR